MTKLEFDRESKEWLDLMLLIAEEDRDILDALRDDRLTVKK